MNKNKIYFTIFSHSKDDDLVFENVLCILDSLPDAEITVVEHQDFPCSPRTKTLCEILGVHWKTTYWMHHSPSDSLIKMEEFLTEMLSRSLNENDILVKIDPDTALLDARELLEFARSKKSLWACGCPNTKIFGNLFALKAYAARTLLNHLSDLNNNDESPWDIKIKDMLLDLLRSSHKDIFSQWWLSGTLLPWARFDWDLYPDISSYSRHAVVIMGDPSVAGFSNETRGEAMRKLRLDRN